MAPDFQVELSNEHDGYFWGDCDDAATLSASLCYALGIECKIVAIRLDGDKEFSHVFTRTLDFDIDPIVPLTVLPHTGFAEKIELAL